MTLDRSDPHEEWAAFPRDPRYLVSTNGRVRGVRGDIIKPQRCGDSGQYRKVRTGHKENTRVDYMVLEAFVGPRPAGMECCHANDIQSDNRLSNLRWGTHQENCLDRTRNGCLDACYERKRKASPREVRLLREQGLTYRDIAELLGIATATAYRNSK